MRLLSSISLLAFAASLFATDASAVMTIVAQDRSVNASAHAENYATGDSDSESDSHTAPDNAPFVQGAAAGATVGSGDASGGGTQNSTLGANVISAFGTCGMYADAYEDDVESSCNGSSNFSVTFSIAETAAYSLVGTISAYDSGDASVTLTGPGGNIYGEWAGGNLEITVNEAGALDPGEYTLQAQTSGGAYAYWSSDYASGDYNLTLNVDSTVGVDAQSWGGIKASFR